MRKIARKTLSLILALTFVLTILPANLSSVSAATQADLDLAASYEALGSFLAIPESYTMSGGTVSASTGNFGTTYISGNANMIIYKIPLPAYHPSREMDKFVIRFGRGGTNAFKVLKMSVSEWSFSSLPKTYSKYSNPLSSFIFWESTANSHSALTSGTSVITVPASISDYNFSYADLTTYAKECYNNKLEYFYVGVGAWNSTTNCALASMTDTTYRGAEFYPCYSYTMKSPYSDPAPTYPTVTSEEISGYVEALNGEHPRLFGRADDFARIKEYAFGKDAAMTEMYRKYKDEATVYVDKAVSTITTDIVNNSYLSRATNALDIMLKCSFIYAVEGDASLESDPVAVYADRAIAEAMYFAEQMETWGRAQSLDVNHTALGIAICYDWLYNYMTEEQKSAIGGAMYTKHLDEIYDFFTNPEDEAYKWSFHQMYLASNNHAVLDNCSVFVEALAVADLYPEKASTIMALALEHLTRKNGPFDRLYPDAGWYEGSSYWSYVGPFMAKMFSAMESAFGSCLGFENNPYITGGAYFPLYTQSSLRRLVYSDAGTARTEASDFYWFGLMSGDEALKKYVIDNKYYSTPLLCLWYNPENAPSGELSLQKDKLFRNIDVATMRSTWDSPQETFVGMAVQAPKETHAFMAMGTLALDALGETWITNPGKEDYDIGDYWNTAQDGTRWTYYSTRTEANSCLVINPSEDGGQIVTSPAMIDKIESSDSKAFMVTDLSTAYTDASSYKRGVMLYNNRSRVLVQDEVTLKKTSDVYSFINVYKADIDISDDGSYAILSKGNKHIYVKVISDKPYTLTTYEACSTALGTSPNPDGQTDFTADYERLCVKYDDVSGNINLSVIMVPFLSDNIPEINETQVAIANWTTAESEAQKPVLTSLSINGTPVDGFDSNVNYYKIPLKYFEAIIDAVASDNATIEVKNNYKNNCFDVYLTNPVTGAKNLYTIEIVLEGAVIADNRVGGSSGDLGKNFGADESIYMRIMKQYSIMSYFKINMPYIPYGKKAKTTSMVINQYRKTDSANKDGFEFHLVDPNLWQENTITYNNAPVRHTYVQETWYPYTRKNAEGKYEPTVADYKTGSVNIKTIPEREDYNDRFYTATKYDLTTLVEKSDFDTQRTADNIFSFCMGHYIIGEWSSSSSSYIASKEHSNPALRPKVLVELEDAETETVFAAEKGKVVANPKGDELYFTTEDSKASEGDKVSALTYFTNLDTENAKSAVVYLAQYNKGELLTLTPYTISVNAGQSKTVLTPSVDVSKGATEFEVFVWVEGQKPIELK